MTESRDCLLTNDVETQSIWFNCLRDETARNVLNQGMPRLLDIYAKNSIHSTFFFTGYIAKKFPELVKMIQPAGHEVACHGFTHEITRAFDLLTYEEQVEHLSKSKKILEDISGQEVIAFRAPALRVNRFTPVALNEAGFRIDSSVASQRFDMFLSFGGVEKLKRLTAPRRPYKTDPQNLYKRGVGPVVEVPLTAFLFPYVGTTLRIFPRLTRFQRMLCHLESSVTGKPVVFDIHPNEFLDEGTGGRIISRRSQGFLAYLLKDLLRSKLKVRNLGAKAIPLYTAELEFYVRKRYQFLTIAQYVSKYFN